jgi:hypothetical protein
MPSYYATNLITGTTTAAALTGDQPLRRPAVDAAAAGTVKSVTGTIIFASGVNLDISAVIELAILPADHVLLDWMLLNDDFDSATTVTVKMGLMTGSPGDADRLLATVGVELLASGATTLQSAAVTRGSVVASITGMRTCMASSSSDRSIGLGIVAAPTDPATIRRLDFVMYYRSAYFSA